MGLAAAQKIGVYFLKGNQLPSCFAPTQSALTTTENAELKTRVLMEDMLTFVRTGQKCVLILTVSDREELASVANGLFSIKKEIKDRKVMAVVFLKFSSDKVEQLLVRAGCAETMKFDASAKAFTYKVKRYIKLLEQEDFVESVTEVAGGKAEAAEAGKAVTSNRANAAAGYLVQITEEWKGQDDYWLFRKKNYAKKYQGKWLIEIIGPSPAAGEWVSAGDNRWQWKIRKGYEFFNPSPAVWEFIGKQPQYNWVINRWGFVSENPSLNLLHAGELVYSRFYLSTPNTLDVPGNSDYARSIFPKIKETYDKEFHFKNEQKNSKMLQANLSADEMIPWADRTNSKDISLNEWKSGDLSSDSPREWGTGRIAEVLTGLEALDDCGIRGSIKTYPVELLEFDEAEATVSVGLDSALVEYKELIEVLVESDNLNLPPGMKLRGVVTHLAEENEFGKTVAVMLTLQSSREEFKRIRDAVNMRQREVFAFFERVRGSGG